MSSQQQLKVFKSASVSFETHIKDSICSTFGIIQLDATEMDDAPSNSNRKIDMQIRIDNSGSMSDPCSDGRTKMQHVIFAVGQILRKVSEGNVSTTVDIRSFDDRIVPIISGNITPDSVEEMVSKVGGIFPNGGTNILSVLSLEANHVKTDESLHIDRVFILLSDGQDTTGCGRDTLIQMAESIHVNTHVIMIGVGNGHDSALFKGILIKRISGNYTPVSNVEDISIAISELIYGILKKLLKRPVITVSNGEIYSWTSNSCGKESIQIDDIVIGRKKTFMVWSLMPESFSASIEGTLISGDNFKLDIADIHFGADLMYDKYRHRTMVLIAESVLVDYSNVKELKTKLKNMMIELKAYMDENKLRDDKKFQVLCDDIFMCHQTMGSIHGAMYATARQISQGTQSIYSNQQDLTPRVLHMSSCQTPRMTRAGIPTVSRGITGFVSKMREDEDDELPPVPTMMRSVSLCIHQMSKDEEKEKVKNAPFDFSCPAVEEYTVDDDDTMSSHQMLASDDSPYANLTELAFIREVSIGKQKSSSI